MEGRPERAMRAGVVVCFRAEIGGALLWKARMSSIPRVDDICVRFADEVETEYKVETVRFEFLHENASEPTGYIDGVPYYDEFTASALTYTGPIVTVSPVP